MQVDFLEMLKSYTTGRCRYITHGS
jgi:hypothetical protein